LCGFCGAPFAIGMKIEGPLSWAALVPVVDMKVRMAFNLTWKKDDSSPVVQKFEGQVKAL
jgi:hypothetical protein